MTTGGRAALYPSDHYVWLSGAVVLRSAFALSVAIILLTAWQMPALVPFVPLFLLSAVGGWSLFRRPLANLTVVLCAFAVTAGFEKGIQVSEVLYGLYYLGFLAHWFFTRLILGGGRVFERTEDAVLFAFLVLIIITVPVTVVFGGSLGGVARELLSFSVLAFYWPVKEAVTRYKHGLEVMVGVVLFIGTFVLIRNFLNYQEIIASASYAWQITRGRAVTNEGLLMVPAILGISFFLYARSRTVRWSSVVAVVVFFAGLILTQSRGYWVAFLFGSGILFLLVPWTKKFKLAATAALAGLGAFAIGAYLFGDVLVLILTGLFDRFLSIATAVGADDSLRTRFSESAAVWEMIRVNPILGYGMGVDYRYYDFTVDVSYTRAFIHNGYLSLWFKFGIWGLCMVLFFLGTSVKRAYSVFRSAGTDMTVAATSLSIVCSFAAFSLVAITSNPFYLSDRMFLFAVLCGMAAGMYNRLSVASNVDG